jgi:4-diphosphocytidyl-2-C-methyl-D-erythritol kinase
MPAVRLRAFAKINLGLRVLGRRPDDYHEIRTIYQTVTLADRLQVSVLPRSAGISVEVDDPAVPGGRGNLVYRACERWRQASGFRGGVQVKLEKRIPAGSGLGGASSDAAAALWGLEHLTGDRLSPVARFSLAAGLGSDVPFFLVGGRALGCGRGEEVYPLPDLPRRPCLVIFPGFSQSTREAYQDLDCQLTAAARPRSIDSFGVWSQFPNEGWGPAENDFEKVVFAKWPKLRSLRQQLLRAGAETASLSGSGSAIYAIWDTARQLSAARRLVPPGWRAFAVRTLPRSEYRRRLFDAS